MEASRDRLPLQLQLLRRHRSHVQLLSRRQGRHRGREQVQRNAEAVSAPLCKDPEKPAVRGGSSMKARKLKFARILLLLVMFSELSIFASAANEQSGEYSIVGIDVAVPDLSLGTDMAITIQYILPSSGSAPLMYVAAYTVQSQYIEGHVVTLSPEDSQITVPFYMIENNLAYQFKAFMLSPIRYQPLTPTVSQYVVFNNMRFVFSGNGIVKLEVTLPTDLPPTLSNLSAFRLSVEDGSCWTLKTTAYYADSNYEKNPLSIEPRDGVIKIEFRKIIIKSHLQKVLCV